jgi:hypothetical protein
MTDPLLRMLADLPSADPDPLRGARVRARCRSQLERRQRSSREPSHSGAARLWQPIIAGLSGIYLVEVIREALRVYGIL